MFATSSRAALVGALVVGLAAPSFAACPSDACSHASKSKMRTVTYPVADLILAVGGVKPSEDKLMQLIAATISPKTWSSLGGEGSQVYYPLTMSLIVQQSAEVHEQIADLLATMRRQMDIQVALEMRIIQVSEETVEALGLENHQSSGSPAVAFLDDTQLRVLMERVQGDTRANVMQAPKMTMLNGQKGTFEVSDKKGCVVGMDSSIVEDRKSFTPRVQTVTSGVKIGALPIVSADRRFVKLHLGIELSRIDSPMPTYPVVCADKSALLTQYLHQPRLNAIQLENTLVIPDGKTALLCGWKTLREVRNESGPPVLGRIPYINRLFKNVSYGYQTEQLLVLVTPRIIVTEEQEEKSLPAPSKTIGKEEASEPESTATESKDKAETPAEKEVPADPVATLYVKDKKFQLTYDLDNVGHSQVKQIEVWWTKDSKTWERFADDVKPTGKVVIAVKEEGTYGFKLNARSGAGLSSPAPKAGDRPHTWVVVDTTPPVIKMEPVKVVNDNNGEVVIEWAVSDDHLASRPVTVRYAEKPEGPWKELVLRGAATDTYRCAVSKLPAVAYFRVDATDKSGNVGTAWTTEPVKVDLKVPQIRNVNVKPSPGN